MLPDSYVSRIDASGDCWLWTGYRDRHGYGRTDGRLAHRLVYTAMVGPIADDLTLDHLCRVPSCVNPDHLEPVGKATNTLRGYSFSAINARKDRCISGHPLIQRGTRRVCHECERQATARYKKRHAA